MQDDELLFELHGPDGQVWRVYLDGRVQGFPPGTKVVNHALPAVNRLIGEVKPHPATELSAQSIPLSQIVAFSSLPPASQIAQDLVSLRDWHR